MSKSPERQYESPISIEGALFEQETWQLYRILERVSQLENVRTGVGFIIQREGVNGQAEYLVVHNKKNGSIGNPAGHLNPGEDLLIGAYREAYEETTLPPSIFQINGIQDAFLMSEDGNGPHRLFVIFKGTLVGKTPDLLYPTDYSINYATFMSAERVLGLVENDLQHPGAIVLYGALTNPSRKPLEILTDLMIDFRECRIPMSVIE